MVKSLSELRVAIVHYWLLQRRGGEKVVEAIANLFPQAHLYAVLADRKALSPALQRLPLTTSFLQYVPGSRKLYRHLLPLHPLALEQFDLRGYDLIISSESAPAKGILAPPAACHICYCHSPMRYIWDMYQPYRRGLHGLSRHTFTFAAHYLRLWDSASASRVDHFVANSAHVANRIRRYYGRESVVIHPPVDVSAGYLSPSAREYYLIAGRLTGYKRVDLAIEACNRLRRPLHVVGDGACYKQLRRLAGITVKFLGSLPDSALHEQYADCHALLFPGEEDFGMVPVEAQSFGRPVIAYGRGGALETVRGFSTAEASDPEECTGVFFPEQTPDSLVNAIRLFESVEARFSPRLIQSHAWRFDVSRFKDEITQFVASRLRQRGQGFVDSIQEHKQLSAVAGAL